jgi:alkylated DNA repair protein (DNA oxidative demethylase)
MTPSECPSTKMDDLFADVAPSEETVKLEDGATLFPGCAAEIAPFIVEAISQIAKTSPFRHMVSPSGYAMSVEMTNRGRAGLTTDRKRYRYATIDPETNAPWPSMPLAFQRLVEMTTERAGFSRFKSDSCL